MLLLDLPNELLIAILSNLDPASFRSCMLVCRLFKALMDGESPFICDTEYGREYILALNQAGYVDGPSTCTVSTAERLRRLQHHQSAWGDLSWDRMDTYNIDHRTGTYELYGGVYAQGLENLVDPMSQGTRGLELVEFPSLLRNQAEGHRWKIPDFGFDVKDFGMDPDKDLLVLVEKPPQKTLADPNPSLSVHLLALRDPDAKPHPLAQHPVLFYKPRIWHRKYHYWIQVIGDVLAVMFMPEIQQQDQPIADQLSDETVIWKWKTGELVTSIRCEPGYEAGSFSFLTNDIIVIPTTKDERIPELRLYRLPTQRVPSEATSSSAKASTLLALFHFPEFKHSVMACGIICRADPSPWVPPSRSPIHRNVRSSERDYAVPVWPAHGAAPFAPHPSSRLLVISLDIVTMGGWPGWAAQQVPWQQPMSRKRTIFTKGDVLLEAWRKGLDARTRDAVDCSSVVEIPWEDWGPPGTRMLSEATDPSAVCYVYGLRYIRLVAMGADEDRAVHIRVMDFNDREFDRSYHEDVVAQTAGAEEKSGRDEECGAPEEPELALDGINEEPAEVTQELAEQLLIVDDGDGDGDWVGEEEEEGENEEDEELAWEVQETNLARSARRRRDMIPGFDGLCMLRPEEKAQCERMGIAFHDSYVEDDYVFKNRITTSLPFRWSFKTAPEIQRWTSCMLDDEHIIGLKRTQRSSLSDIAVSVDILTL